MQYEQTQMNPTVRSEGSHTVLCDSISLRCPDEAKPWKQEAGLWLPGWMGTGSYCWHKGSLLGEVNGLKLNHHDGCTTLPVY